MNKNDPVRRISNENEEDQSQVLLQPPKTQEKQQLDTLLVDSLLFIDFTKDEELRNYQDQFNER